MKRYITYFKHVFKHKWFVLMSVKKVNPSIHLYWRCLIHDLSKFKPSEFIPYAHTFVDDQGNKRYLESDDFNRAWNDHQKINKHHWQYFILKKDVGDFILLDMPSIYIQEMICDWLGAGRAITGQYDYTFQYYKNNKQHIMLSPKTQRIVDGWVEMITLENSTIKGE